MLDGHILPIIHSIRRASDLKSKPLIVGYNRDEMNFFFAQNRDTEIYALTEDTLKARLERELGLNAAAVLAAYRKEPARRLSSRPVRGDRVGAVRRHRLDRRLPSGSSAQHGAPVYMYVFTHESER